jgi:CheY-like chemotaxis protein
MTALEPLPGRVVLLVEDDEAFRATLAEQLRQLDVQVHVASSAEAAVDALAGGLGVHGMVSDIRLGQGPSGIDLARTVHARWPALPVLLMSGELPQLAPDTTRQGTNPAEAIPLAREAGADYPQFLQKPFALAQLLEWLRALPVSSM